MDPITLRYWRAGEDTRRAELELGVTQTFLRLREHPIDGWVVESLHPNVQVSMSVFLKFYAFARRARRANTPRFTRMKIERWGRGKDTSATHAGDLRVGCTLVPWVELVRIHDQLIALPAALK